MTIEKISDKVPTYTPVLWTWSTNKEGLHPVKIRVTYTRDNKYYNVQHEGQKIFLSQAQWDDITMKEKDDNGYDTEKVIGLKQNLRGNNRRIVEVIEANIAEAKKAGKLTMSGDQLFTFSGFERNFIKRAVTGGFFGAFEDYLEQLKKEQRIGTLVAYNNAYSAFKKFRNDKNLNPAEISVQMLKDFEQWLKTPRKGEKRKKAKKAGPTTIAMYMRTLRVIYNAIAEDHPELRANYPFMIRRSQKNKYKIPLGSGNRKGDVLNVPTLAKFISIETEEGTPEHSAKQYYLLSLYAQGANFRDLAFLKFKDVSADAIRYVREKTKRTTTGDREIIIEVPFIDELQALYSELRNQDTDPDNFVFPIVTPGADALQHDKEIRQFIKTTNAGLKSLCEANKLPVFTTYSARHSYASLMKDNGYSLEMVRESLGHADIATTEGYTTRFNIKERKKANEAVFKLLKSA